MLFINESDMKKSVTYQQVMDKVEDGYRIFAGGRFYMPHRPVIEHGKETLLYMPCFMDKYFGTKFLTLFPDNPSKGLPFIDGLMILNDGETGKILAILDAKFLTALRTGAVGGVGVRCFAPAESRSVGVIGAGKQGFFQLLYACEARNIEEIFIFDTVLKDFDSFIEALKKELGDKKPQIQICQTVEELVNKCDIVITATTSSSPVVPDDPGLFEGKCFIAIGSYKPEARELPNAIWKAVDVVYTELPFACEARNIEEIFIFDTVLKNYDSFIEALKKELGDKKPRIQVCLTVEELVNKSDIVITATTSNTPVVPDDPGLFEGKCFIAIGSYKPEVRELPNAIWKAVDVVYTELPFACEESGDLCQPLRDGIIDMGRVKYIGDLLTDTPRPVPPKKGVASYFKSVGMGLMDLCVSQLIYEEAVKKGTGRQLSE